MASHMIGNSDEIKGAQKALKVAEKEHDKAVKTAEAILKSATISHDAEINKISAQQRMFTQKMNGVASSFGEAKLYGDHISFRRMNIQLSPDITATVSTSGNIYSTTNVKGGSHVSLGGAAVGAMVAGPAGMILGGHKNKVSSTSTTHDTRRVFVEVSSANGSFATEGGPEEEADAHEFAAKVMEYGRNYQQRKTDNDKKIAEFDASIAEVSSHTEGIDAAKSALDAVKADTGAVDKARARFRSVAGISAEDERAEESKRSERKRTVRFVGSLVALGAVIIICACVMQDHQPIPATIAAFVAILSIKEIVTIIKKHREHE